MTGLIWLIQNVHYPTFKFISEINFKSFHAFHSKFITYIVGPIMTLELVTGLYFLKSQNFYLKAELNALGIILIWITKAFLSVPTHNQLGIEKNKKSIEFLIATN
jgi:hypothetical protein